MVREPRSDRSLRMLLASADGLRLNEILGGLADLEETARHASAATVTMLRTMRLKGRVSFEPGVGGAGGGGTYRITPAGAAWLARRAAKRSGEDDLVDQADAIVATGAMEGEWPVQRQSEARAGQVPAGLVNSVFMLASWSTST